MSVNYLLENVKAEFHILEYNKCFGCENVDEFCNWISNHVWCYNVIWNDSKDYGLKHKLSPFHLIYIIPWFLVVQETTMTNFHRMLNFLHYCRSTLSRYHWPRYFKRWLRCLWTFFENVGLLGSKCNDQK